MEDAERLFSGMQQPHGPVAPNSITFAIMMGAYLAQDKPHQVRRCGVTKLVLGTTKP